MSLTHPFICSDCGRSFRRQRHLEIHSLTHKRRSNNEYGSEEKRTHEEKQSNSFEAQEYSEEKQQNFNEEKYSTLPISSEISNSTTPDTSLCVCCLDIPVDTLLVPCGHVALCRQCSSRVQKCPLCRTKVARAVPAVQAPPAAEACADSKEWIYAMNEWQKAATLWYSQQCHELVEWENRVTQWSEDWSAYANEWENWKKQYESEQSDWVESATEWHRQSMNWWQTIASFQIGDDAASIEEVFETWDADGDGFLDAYELKAAMEHMTGQNVSIESAQAMIHDVDEDGDGTISIEEYRRLQTKSSLENDCTYNHVEKNETNSVENEYAYEQSPPPQEPLVK
eukprot:g2486.t1